MREFFNEDSARVERGVSNRLFVVRETFENARQSVDEMWFKSMWLSNGDFLRYFTAALDVGVARGELLLLNAMSANTGMRWSIAETEAALGVRAVDNSLPNHA